MLKQYDDLERVAMERKAEDRSRKEIRMDPRVCLSSFLFYFAFLPGGDSC